MKFLIAGYGSIGRRHFRNLAALGEHDIVLLRSHRSTLPTDEIAGVPVETDIRAALGHHPDAVIVSNPTALHLDVAIPAAEAGCAVLLEKPIAHSLKRVDDLRNAAQKNGSRVLVGFQFRFHPTLQLAAKLLKEGAIGQPLVVRAHWGEYLPGWHPWEDFRQGYAARSDLGGGVLLTLCHPFDYLGWLIGEIASLAAFTTCSPALGLPVEDSAEVALRFANGAIGSVHLDYVQQPAEHTLQIVGSAGTLKWNNADGQLSIYTPAQGWQSYTPPEGFERNVMFVDEMRHFIAVARGEAQPLCTLEDGVRALRVSLAARDSSADLAKRAV